MSTTLVQYYLGAVYLEPWSDPRHLHTRRLYRCNVIGPKVYSHNALVI